MNPDYNTGTIKVPNYLEERPKDVDRILKKLKDPYLMEDIVEMERMFSTGILDDQTMANVLYITPLEPNLKGYLRARIISEREMYQVLEHYLSIYYGLARMRGEKI